MVWIDNMVVPNKVNHKANVEAMMNFYYDPVNAAQLGGLELLPLPGSVGARDPEIAKFDKSAVDSPYIFLEPETMAGGPPVQVHVPGEEGQELPAPVQRGHESPSESTGDLRFKGITKKFGDFVAVEDLNLTVGDGPFSHCWDRAVVARPRPSG